MQALENKAKTVEKISGQLQELVRTNGGTVPENTGMGTGGIGGASTVPDIAKTAGNKKEDDEKIAVSETPGELLKEMRRLDELLDKQIRLVVALRSEFMNGLRCCQLCCESHGGNAEHMASCGSYFQLLRIQDQSWRYRIYLP